MPWGNHVPDRDAKDACAQCGKQGASIRCPNCRVALYCNKACLKAHKKHKKSGECAALANAAAAVEEEPAPPPPADTSLEQATDSYSYQFTSEAHKARPPVEVMQDLQGLGSASTSGDAAWCWRLWHGSIVMAAYIETHALELVASNQHYTVLELGAGTGLVSVSATRCGATCIVTDLPCATGLLKHNAARNFEETLAENAAAGESGEGSVTCPEGHQLSAITAEHEDYLCNVCDGFEDDVCIGSTVYCCRECDFDLCAGCFDAGASGVVGGALPNWFVVQCCNSAQKGSAVFSDPSGGRLLVQPLDFCADDAVRNALDAAGVGAQGVDFPSRVLAADCTYDPKLVPAFVRTLCDVRKAAVDQGQGSLTALVLHDPRSTSGTDALIAELETHQLTFERKNLDAFAHIHERAPEMMLLQVPLI